MPALFIYLLKANIALALFYLAYRFGLRRLTFYILNRFFLLFGILFSATFPLLDLNSLFLHHERLADSITYYAPRWNTVGPYLRQDPFTVWTLLQYVFWAGALIMAIRLCIQLLSLVNIHARTTDGMVNEDRVKLMTGKINPFSFFRNIYINPSLYHTEELANIITHEKIHVRGWHTIDVLTGEVNNIFYWFNPGAWLMKTAIRENLEFIADQKILKSGADAKAYQYSLIRVSSAPFAIPLVNHFNFSHLKARIRMMNKKRSSGFHLLRYLFLLPVITIVIVVFTSAGKEPMKTKNSRRIAPVTTVRQQALTAAGLLSNLKISPDAITNSIKGDSTFASRAYAALTANDLKKAALLAQQSLKLHPENKAALRVLRYLKQLKDHQKNTGRYRAEKNSGTRPQVHYTPPHPNRDSTPRVHYTPPHYTPPHPNGNSTPRIHYTPPHYTPPHRNRDSTPRIHYTPPRYTPPVPKKDSGLKSSGKRKEARALRPYRFTVPGSLPEDKDSLKRAVLLNPVKPPLTHTYTDEAALPLPYRGMASANGSRGKISYFIVNNSLQPSAYDNATSLHPYPFGHNIPGNLHKAKNTTSDAVSLYPAKPFDMLTTPSDDPVSFQRDTLPTHADAVIIGKEPGKVVYFVDNKMVDSGYLRAHLRPRDINSISIVKGAHAISLYGKKAGNGVIRIYTKNFVARHPGALKTDTIRKVHKL
ncbi:MAG TPA: M56 family metallopeptidase [Chitinophagaceae bacterium]|nr:M56 family metallopeptidase [Chitinophagaceae bacterium]